MHSSEPSGDLFGKMDTTVGFAHVPTFFVFFLVRWLGVCKIEFLASLRGGTRLLIFIFGNSRAGA